MDTGGFEPVATEGILYEMAKQTRQAIAEADVVVFLVDGRVGLTSQDITIADLLRRSGRPVGTTRPMSPTSPTWISSWPPPTAKRPLRPSARRRITDFGRPNHLITDVIMTKGRDMWAVVIL